MPPCPGDRPEGDEDIEVEVVSVDRLRELLPAGEFTVVDAASLAL